MLPPHASTKHPFAGPEGVLAYLSHYTHRVAISSRRLVAMADDGVTLRWKDYRAKGRARHKTMTLAPEEFMCRFLLHVLPVGFHRLRHYGLLANAARPQYLAKARVLLDAPRPDAAALEFSRKQPFAATRGGLPRSCQSLTRAYDPILPSLNFPLSGHSR